jgi:hypothetical protein
MISPGKEFFGLISHGDSSMDPLWWKNMARVLPTDYCVVKTWIPGKGGVRIPMEMALNIVTPEFLQKGTIRISALCQGIVVSTRKFGMSPKARRLIQSLSRNAQNPVGATGRSPADRQSEYQTTETNNNPVHGEYLVSVAIETLYAELQAFGRTPLQPARRFRNRNFATETI